jgi:hypothetical protein
VRRLVIALALGSGLALAGGPARAIIPLRDPIALNIGLSCQWRQDCISGQHRAMKKSLGFVRKYKPPTWRIELCNRNAARGRFRVDWVGFDHCIRNEALRPPPPPPPPPPAARKKRHRAR